MVWRNIPSTFYHLQNADMTPELQDDLMNFSFDNLQNVLKIYHIQNSDGYYNICYFSHNFLGCLKKLVCHHVCSSVL